MRESGREGGEGRGEEGMSEARGREGEEGRRESEGRVRKRMEREG